MSALLALFGFVAGFALGLIPLQGHTSSLDVGLGALLAGLATALGAAVGRALDARRLDPDLRVTARRSPAVDVAIAAVAAAPAALAYALTPLGRGTGKYPPSVLGSLGFGVVVTVVVGLLASVVARRVIAPTRRDDDVPDSLDLAPSASRPAAAARATPRAPWSPWPLLGGALGLALGLGLGAAVVHLDDPLWDAGVTSLLGGLAAAVGVALGSALTDRRRDPELRGAIRRSPATYGFIAGAVSGAAAVIVLLAGIGLDVPAVPSLVEALSGGTIGLAFAFVPLLVLLGGLTLAPAVAIVLGVLFGSAASTLERGAPRRRDDDAPAP
ncbi:MAG: hypothetical protein H6745_22560 [Deltaproteobacteria bacterium]|nr:hypothetical protein [Deltaproteobacteria bacterium]